MASLPLDCVVIGGGPAGLTAALYLARFHLDVLVVDAGAGRAITIPNTRNQPGFVGGIPGRDLVARMREQAVQYGAAILTGEVTALVGEDGLFTATGSFGERQARTALVATGVVNHHPAMDQALHDRALAQGRLRYCPICDGYEVTDARVGVIGTGERGPAEALFLRGYTADVTLMGADGALELDDATRQQLDEAGVATAAGPTQGFAIEGEQFRVDLPAGPMRFDSVYPAMGSHIRSELARDLGAVTSPDGCLQVDDHGRTGVAGLYAAGDVVRGLDQISHAMGQGGVAATAIRNDLAAQRSLYR